MPSIVVTMDAATETLATERKNAKIKLSMIAIDNVEAGADAVLQFQDVFTPAITHGESDPTPDTERDRLRLNVSVDACVTLRDELKDIEFLGKVQVVRGVLDEHCFITFAYDFI